MEKKIIELLDIVEKLEELNMNELIMSELTDQFGMLSSYLAKLQLGIEDIIEHNLEELKKFDFCDSSVLGGLVDILNYVCKVYDSSDDYDTDFIITITETVIRLTSSILEDLKNERMTLVFNGIVKME